MPPSKKEFILNLQKNTENQSPHHISQAIRKEYCWISAYKGDPALDTQIYRGYMIRPELDPNNPATPELPSLYMCIVSLDQDVGWQNTIWVKEMLQVIYPPSHFTSDKDKLGTMLDNRSANEPHAENTLPHVIADKNGFILALGCIVPGGLRDVARKNDYQTAYGLDRLSEMWLIPEEFVSMILSEDFEARFNQALDEIDESC